MIFLSVTPTLILSVIAFMDPELTKIVGLAWDCGAVTTGPVTVPLVMAMGLGLGNAVSATEGFGILSMASICPILAVLSMGMYIQIKQKMQTRKMEA